MKKNHYMEEKITFALKTAELCIGIGGLVKTRDCGAGA